MENGAGKDGDLESSAGDAVDEREPSFPGGHFLYRLGREPSTVEERRLSSWEDLRNQLLANGGSRNSATVLYRGQLEPSWVLDSPLDRTLKSPTGQELPAGISRLVQATPARVERAWQKHLKVFRTRALGLRNDGPSLTALDPDELEILARNYGLVTRLLDWSLSPFVAAFFPLFDSARAEYDGFERGISRSAKPVNLDAHWVLWELRFSVRYDLDATGHDNSNLSVIQKQVAGLERQRAQRGVFTRLADPEGRSLDQCCATGMWPGVRLTKFLVPRADAMEGLWELDLMNIRLDTVYPDLTGTATQANIEAAITSHADSRALMRAMVDATRYASASMTAPYGGSGGGLKLGDLFRKSALQPDEPSETTLPEQPQPDDNQ